MPQSQEEIIRVLEEMRFEIINRYLCSQEIFPDKTDNQGAALTSAIQSLKDYQELRGRINVDKIAEIIKSEYKSSCPCDYCGHIRAKSQDVVNYLGGRE